MDKTPGVSLGGGRRKYVEKVVPAPENSDKKLFEDKPTELLSVEESVATVQSQLDESHRVVVSGRKNFSCSNSKSVGDEIDEDENSSTVIAIPQTKIEAAHEFRLDTVLPSAPVALHFFCCLCGCPAGQDCFTCVGRGHPVCLLCQSDLGIQGCPGLIVEKTRRHLCGAGLQQLKSSFREFMFANTVVGCVYRCNGCTFEDFWNKVETHQKVCMYSSKK